VSTLARISDGWRLSQSPGMTSSPAFVASAATREPVVRRCPCGNSACSGGPNRVPGPMSGKCASVVWARQLLNVSLGPMAALPLVRSSRATQPTRLSKTFHRPARMPPARQASRSPGPPTQPSPHPPFPGPPRPGNRPGSGRTQGNARSAQPRTSSRTTASARPLSVARPSSRSPSVAVRAKPTIPRTAPRPRFPSAMRPWMPQQPGSQRDKVTHHGTRRNDSHSRKYAASGLFPQGVAGDRFEPSSAEPTVLQPYPPIRVLCSWPAVMCSETEFGAAAVRYASVRCGPVARCRTDGHGRRRQEAAPSRPDPGLCGL
jgi:hypothetical protein